MKQAFISWSGPSARKRATALKLLLKDVLPEANIFMSQEDIPAGSLWLSEINTALDSSFAGVVVVTPENVGSPWLHFEAGALATRVEQKMVIPLLCGVDTTSLQGSPLAFFQALSVSREAVLQICRSFVEALDISRAESQLERAFSKWWDEHADVICAEEPTRKRKTEPTLTDVFSSLERLQSYAQAQSDAILQIQSRDQMIAPAIVGQGPFATASINDAITLLASAKPPRDLKADSIFWSAASKAALRRHHPSLDIASHLSAEDLARLSELLKHQMPNLGKLPRSDDDNDSSDIES